MRLFHHAGIKAGFACNGLPGLRPHLCPHYYAAFLGDPDGSNIEAMTYIESSHAANTSQHCATLAKRPCIGESRA